MSDDRKKSVWPWIVALLIGLPVLYVASFGPACWITSHANVGAPPIPAVYRPLTWAMSPDSYTTINRVSTWYAKLGADENWEWGPVHDPAGQHVGWMWGSTAGLTTF